jgi:hypothetical protein
MRVACSDMGRVPSQLQGSHPQPQGRPHQSQVSLMQIALGLFAVADCQVRFCCWLWPALGKHSICCASHDKPCLTPLQVLLAPAAAARREHGGPGALFPAHPHGSRHCRALLQSAHGGYSSTLICCQACPALPCNAHLCHAMPCRNGPGRLFCVCCHGAALMASHGWSCSRQGAVCTVPNTRAKFRSLCVKSYETAFALAGALPQ